MPYSLKSHATIKRIYNAFYSLYFIRSINLHYSLDKAFQRFKTNFLFFINKAKIIFREFPTIKQAYDLVQGLRNMYNTTTVKEVAYTKLAHWYNKIENSELKTFNTVVNTIKLNYQSILNYFDNRSTNASAESFNAKIKAFRTQFRGVRDIEFFLYRLVTIFA